ncbi:MAG: putative toxin-antitoxin system toxin component, PIN family, partial [Candidatus Sungbacteria bacterium]|nr:putative toxin-antitoxin system toxin component, PIN family [Candidatus Sungbacteria bacterium]
MRFVFDTNVVIDAFNDNFNASSRLIQAVCDGEVEAAVTRRVIGEYRLILRRLGSDPVHTNRIQEFLDQTVEVRGIPTDVAIDDAEDRKIIEAALGGQADAVVTSDRHLLDIGEIGSVQVITPTEAWQRVQDTSGSSSEWLNFIKGIGIGVFLLLLTTYCLQLTTASVYAQEESAISEDQATIDEAVQKLQAQQQQISDKENEIKQLEAKIAQLKGKRDTTAADAQIIAAQVTKLEGQLAKAALELKQTQLSITVTTKKKSATEKDISELQDQIASKKEILKSLLRSLYTNEQQSVIRLFFDTLSLSDVLAQQATYKELQDRAISLISDMHSQSDDLKTKKQQLEEQEQTLSHLAGILSAQQAEITDKKRQQQTFLKAKQEQQLAYEQKISEVEAAREEIKKQVFTLKGSGIELTLTNAFDMARFAGKLTGVRPALLLAVLKVESNLGANVGSGHYPDDMQPQSREAFLRITKSLGLDPLA